MELNRADQETVVLGSYHVLSHISHAASQSPAADGATKVRSYRLSSSESPSVSIISPDLNKHQTHTTQTSSSDHTHTHTTPADRKSNRKSESVLEMIWTLFSVTSDSCLHAFTEWNEPKTRYYWICLTHRYKSTVPWYSKTSHGNISWFWPACF